MSAGAGKWSLVQVGGGWSRAGSCWCRKVLAGAGLVADGAGMWLPLQGW